MTQRPPRLAVLALGATLSLSAACGGKGGDKAAEGGSEGVKLDAGKEFALKSGKENLAEAKVAVAKGEDPGVDCVTASGYAKQLVDVKGNADVDAFVAEAGKVCGYDGPVAVAEKGIKAAETARAGDPTGVISECFDASVNMALETLQAKHADDAKVKDLVARQATACPKQ